MSQEEQGELGYVAVRIIDVKASTILKPSHQVQIALYRSGLCALLEKKGAEGNKKATGKSDMQMRIEVDMVGEVWRPPDVIDTFDISLAQLFLDAYMRRHYTLFSEPVHGELPFDDLWDLESVDQYLYTSRTPQGGCYKPSTVLKQSRVAQEAEWNLVK